VSVVRAEGESRVRCRVSGGRAERGADARQGRAPTTAVVSVERQSAADLIQDLELYLQQEDPGHYPKALLEDIDAFAAQLRENRKNISEDVVRKVLKDGGEAAKEIAAKKMKEVQDKIGVTL